MVVVRFFIFFLSFISLVSCSSKQAKDRDIIAVTIEPLAYFVEELSCGDYDITVVVPSGASPETYEPTPQAMRDVSDSKAYLSVGLLECETAINGAVDDRSIYKIELYKSIDCIGATHHHHHDDEGECDHGGENIDPHIWSSVKEARVIAQEVCSMLCSINSDSCSKYRAAYDKFMIKLDSLDSYIDGKLANITSNTFVIYHPALAYFAREYKLNQLPIEFEGKEPTISAMKDIIEVIEKESIKYIFYQRQMGSSTADILATQTGCEVIEIDPLSRDWYENMKYITDVISHSINNK